MQFEFNGVGGEIQLHTEQGWAIKKRLDEIYHILREQAINPTLPDEEIIALKQESRRLAQDLDLSIKDFASCEVNSYASGSEKSVLVRKSPTDLNDSQNSPLKSYSNRAFSEGDKAYKRPDSELNQNESFSGGKGNIDKPLASVNPSTPPLKSQEGKTQPLESSPKLPSSRYINVRS